MIFKNIHQCEEFLNALGEDGKREIHPEGHSLRRTLYALSLLDNPHLKTKYVHIGGTSGKTSSSTLVSQILTNSGYKTGLMISPHLQVITERIQINNRFVSENDFCALLGKIAPLFLKLQKDPRWGTPIYFEMMTCLALHYFAAQHTDIAVIEVGIGGRLDCTNVIIPELSIITNVGLDHVDLLGNTIEEITKDKGEIIKIGKPIITGITQKNALQLIKEKVKETKSKLIEINGNLLNDYQDLNKGIAKIAAQELQKLGLQKITDKTIDETINNFQMPGRMEVVSKDPLIILDGAHNREKMEAAVKSLHSHYTRNFAVVYKTLNPQHSEKMLKELFPITKLFFITQHDLPYLPTTNYLLHSTLIDAFSAAKQSGLPILVTGSLYTVGDIRRLYFSSEEMIKQQTYWPKQT